MTPQAAGDAGSNAAAIIVNEGRVLLVRRNIREGQLSGQFPAGELEPGELSSAAAARETLSTTRS